MSFCYVSFWFITTWTTSSTFQKFSRIILEVEEINLVTCSRRELNVFTNWWFNLQRYSQFCSQYQTKCTAQRWQRHLWTSFFVIILEENSCDEYTYSINSGRPVAWNLSHLLWLSIPEIVRSLSSASIVFPYSTDDSGKMELMSSLTCWIRGISFNIGMKRIVIIFIFNIMK